MKCCRWFVMHRLGFALRCLDRQEERVFVRHSRGCRECAGAVRQLEREIGWLGMAVEPSQVPPTLRDRVVAWATGRH